MPEELHHIYCPVEGCSWWAVFGGYLSLFVKAFKQHLKHDHKELDWYDTRTDGGLIDRWIGDMIQKQNNEKAGIVD